VRNVYNCRDDEQTTAVPPTEKRVPTLEVLTLAEAKERVGWDMQHKGEI
jgi:hypothetical protein